MNILSRDLMDQVEMAKEEQDFSWNSAACIMAEFRITLGTLMANQAEFERNIEMLLIEDATAKINAMIEKELK